MRVRVTILAMLLAACASRRAPAVAPPAEPAELAQIAELEDRRSLGGDQLGIWALTHNNPQVRARGLAVGALKVGPKTVLGVFGEFHPDLLGRLGIDPPIAGFELYLDAVPAARRKGAGKALEASDLQPVRRDFAFLIDRDIEGGEVVRAAMSADRALVSDVGVFDVFTGQGVPDGKKSLAIEVTLQPREKTLTDAEIGAVAERGVHRHGVARVDELRPEPEVAEVPRPAREHRDVELVAREVLGLDDVLGDRRHRDLERVVPEAEAGADRDAARRGVGEEEPPVEPHRAGMHIVAMLPPESDDVALSALARERRVEAQPLTPYYHRETPRPGFVLGYAAVPDRAIRAAVGRLAEALDGRV